MSASNATLSDLYHAHATELQRFAGRRVGSQEAEDVVQDTYLHVLQRSAGVTIDHPRAYLFRIAANLSVDHTRRTKMRSCHDVAGLDELCSFSSPDATITDAMEVRRLKQALAELAPPLRTTFLLNRVEGLTYVEIAQRLGLSVRTVDRYMVRALCYLRNRTGRA